MKKPAKQTRLVGITGNIGSGKSTVSRIIRERGYTVLSADEFAREVVAPGSDALGKIQRVFGAEAVLPNGALNRQYVREKIAADPSLRKQLERITHPLIQQLTKARSAELFANGEHLVFYEAPLLFEASSENHVDLVICVAAEEDKLIERTMARDGVTREQAEKILVAQIPQKEKISRSQHVIYNDGSETELAAQVDALLKKLDPAV